MKHIEVVAGIIQDGDKIFATQRGYGEHKGFWEFPGGKMESVITGIPLDEADLKELARTLKQKCGVGGSVKDFTVTIQGDKRNVLKAELEKKGYTVKLAGG